jgi:2-desacetyl-2-hydroxyethyl bacteriochlorophyllide A dehydrogenase
MKALYINEPHHLQLTEKDEPKIKENESLLKVLGCGVCGTDLKIYKGETLATYPLVPGHEIVGEIINSTKYEKGMKVTVDPNKSCGYCKYCREGKPHLCENLKAIGVNRDGGFAEMLSAPNDLLYPLNEGIDVESAIFAEPLSCIIHGIDLSNFSFTDDVAIIGGGAIGLIFTMLFNQFSVGKKVIFEISQEKIKYIQKEFSFEVIHPQEYRKTKEFDIVVECSGSIGGLETAYSLVKKGGRIIVFGVTPKGLKTTKLEPFQIYSEEITMTGSYVNPFTMQRAVKIINSKEFSFYKLLTEKGSLSDVKDYITGEKQSFLKAAFFNE